MPRNNETSKIGATRLVRCLNNIFMAGASTRHYPPEILFIIFQIGLDSADFGDMFSYAVSRVCKYWNVVATSTPALWSTIEIFVDEDPDLRAIHSYLIYSGSLDLDITLCRETPLDDDDDPGIEPDAFEAPRIVAVMQLLNSDIKRWGSLSIQAIHLNSIRVALSICSGVASNLQDLKLCSSKCEGSLTPDIGRVLTTEFQTPAVSSLTLGGEVIPWACKLASSWMDSFAKITILTLVHADTYSLYGHHLCSLLRRSSIRKSLHKLEMEAVSLEVGESPARRLRLDQLNRVYLREMQHIDVHTFLGECIDAPRLRYLDYQLFQDHSDDTHILKDLPFTTGDAQHFPMLCTFLLLHSPPLSEPLPSLDRCTHIVCDDALDNVGLQMLRTPYAVGNSVDQPRWLCPKLNELSILNTSDFSYDLLREVIQTRQSAEPDLTGIRPTPIRRLRLVGCGEIPQDVYDWFQSQPDLLNLNSSEQSFLLFQILSLH